MRTLLTRSLSGRRRGLTIVELIFTSTMTLILMVAVITLFIEMLRLEQSNTRQLAMIRDANDLSRELRQIASKPGVVVDQNFFLTGVAPRTPNSVVPTSEIRAYIQWGRLDDNEGSELLIRDIDGDPTTIGDNSLILVRDFNNPRIARTLNYVSPLEVTGTVTWANAFSRPEPPPGVQYLNSPLQVQLRFGDRINIRSRSARRSDPRAADEDRFTGPSFESVVLNTIYASRVEQG